LSFHVNPQSKTKIAKSTGLEPKTPLINLEAPSRRLVKRNNASDLADMEITVHSDTVKSYENDSSGSELSITFVISIPQEWTPKVFLAAPESFDS
jgi:hypothetical protein